MVTQLPVRIEFRLPEGWLSAPPDEVDAPGAAFVALHPPAKDGFTANITISGEHRPPETTLETVADESVERLAKVVDEAEVLARADAGTEDMPGLTQTLRLASSAGDLVQCQVYLSMADVRDPARRAVIELALTSTAGEFEHEVGDFQEFVRGVRAAEE
ncbi:hypothetical protein [Amycolatopsis sp. H20-H5]|uniref:hypothetical protein n=1 Tax=Amycolatopsis sp. H20-H5 TaxID=3046309 RepID=UPI002DB9D311|nr:hypothetical protein [Amycolatopsis sp. H20-H5]MEC3981466.1 hypothetical protein [Amycolatopsis sp. H20-H5]